MKTKLLSSLFLIILLIGCSTEEANNLEDIQNLEQSNFRLYEEENIPIPESYLIEVEYSERVDVDNIPAIRASFLGIMYSNCSIPTMSIRQNEDPYTDFWLITFLPYGCLPDEDSEDLNTTITNDPRIRIVTNEG